MKALSLHLGSLFRCCRLLVLCCLLAGACTGSWAALPDDKLKWNFQNMEVKALLQSLAEIGQET